MKNKAENNRGEMSKISFSRVILKMIGICISFKSSPFAYLLFLSTSLAFTFPLVVNVHLIRVLLDDIPLFQEGGLPFKTILLTVLLLACDRTSQRAHNQCFRRVV